MRSIVNGAMQMEHIHIMIWILFWYVHMRRMEKIQSCWFIKRDNISKKKSLDRYRFLDGKIVLYDRVDTAFTYVTVIMLVLDPIYLCLLSGAFGGGDVNGILYLMPQAWVWTIFAFILLFNIWILLKKVNPTYTASFKERWNKRRKYGIRYH